MHCQRYWMIGLILLLMLALCAGGVHAQGDVTHTVQAGENLFRIAIYYGTTVDDILAANGLGTVYIFVGQRLVIPNPTHTIPPIAPLTPPPDGSVPGGPTPVPEPAMPGLDARSYLVQPGDALSPVAARLGVSTWALLQENGLMGFGTLVAGQTLRIPEGNQVAPEPTATPEAAPVLTATPEVPAATQTPEPSGPERSYTVQHGDTLTQIAARFGTTVAHVAQLNRIANPSQIYVGQVLRLEGTPPVVLGGSKLIVVSLS
ncbi:MAG: LysM peptidoglycan-binding domain-containing protein, partial [Anaerolineae bacterium]|nr:LysM peptidoglycan-binding domain-containing protein [Anaerolineae bacterium]